MKQWFALSAIGRDRPGIVADLAELIYECDCNLEDSSMTILGSEFAVLLLLTGEEPGIAERLSAACKRLEWEKRLTVFFRPLDAEPIAVSRQPPGAPLCAAGGRAWTRRASSPSSRAVWPTIASTSPRCRRSRAASPSRGRRSTPCGWSWTCRREVDEQALRERLEGVARELVSTCTGKRS